MGRQTRAIQLSPVPIVGAVIAAAFATGLLASVRTTYGLGLLVAALFISLVLVDLPLAIAVWTPILFLKYISHFSTAGHVAVALMAAGWFGTIRVRRETAAAVVLRHRRVFMCLAVFLVWIAASLAWSTQPSMGSATLVTWITSAFVFVLISTTISTPRTATWLIVGFIVGGVASVMTGQTQGGRLIGGAGDPNELAQGLVPAIALAGTLLTGTRNALARFALAVGIVVMIIGVGATQSRGGLIAAGVAVAASLVFAPRSRRRVIALLLPALGVAALWAAASPSALHRITSIGGSGGGRVSLWTVGWRITEDHPIVGVGLNNFRVREPAYAQQPGLLPDAQEIIRRPQVVHNIYLELLAETGVIGLGLFLAFIAAALRTAWLAAKRFDDLGERALANLSRAVLVGTISFLTAAFFLTDAYDTRLWVLLAMGPALLGIAARQRQASTDAP